MKKDYIGFSTGKIHDSNNPNFSHIVDSVMIKNIECYYSDNEGIYGLFPFYKNENMDEKILKMEDSFYTDFKKIYLQKLKEKCLTTGDKIITLDIEFVNGEEIKSIVASYDEINKSITALKIKTNLKNFSIGKVSDLKEKNLIKILQKDNHVITGFKTCYMTEKSNECALSFIKAYYETEQNIQNYFKTKQYESLLERNLFKKFRSCSNIFINIAKFLFWLILLIFPFAFYYYKSQNIYGGELTIPIEWGGVDHPVKIYTDHHGFYHIKAESRKDGFFAIGFLHAKDRLWQMDFNRRVGRGKLSEIFGTKSLPIDNFIRSIGLNEMSLRFESDIKKNLKFMKEMDSYIDGINYYANNFILPIEYHMMNVKWDNWVLADTLGVLNIITLTLNHDWNMEIWYKMMEENLGKEFADLVINFRDVDYPFWDETILSDDELVDLNLHKNKEKLDEIIQREREIIRIKEVENLNENSFTSDRKVDPNSRYISEDINKKSENDKKEANNENKPHPIEESITKMLTETFNNQAASNSWAITGKHTESGFPIIANDPHLTNSIPGMFHQLKLYLPDNTLVATTIPGNPLMFIGSNKYIAWGFTTENSDTVDICEEKIEDDYYLYDDKKYKITTTQETIYIKNSEPQILEVKWTRNGPLLTNELPKELIAINLKFKHDTPISLRLPFYYFRNTNLEFLYALNYAEKPSDFLNLTDKFISPNLNIVYATTKGEIGWTPIGLFPVKNYKNRFCRGYTKEDDIVKYIKKAELPILKNPEKGFIITANNKFANFNYTYNMYGFHNHVRAFRIREMIEEKLKSNEKFDLQANIDIAKDLKDSLAAYTLPKILKIVERNTKSASKLKYYPDLLAWDHVMEKDSPTPTIWSVLELNIGLRLLTNKVSEPVAKGLISMLHYWNFISGIVDKIYQGERIDMKQCAHGTGNVNCEKYLVFIFNGLDKFLEEGGYKDKNGNIYNWGEIKFNNYPHPPLDIIPIVNKIFSRKVYTGGNRNTVKISRGPFNHDKGQFTSTHSPRMRFICDMKEPNRPYIMLDTGNSGSVLSRFYDNLMEKSENTEYVQIEEINFEEITSHTEMVIILK